MSASLAAGLGTRSDQELVELVTEGSDAAFEEVVGRHRSALLAYCRRIGLSSAAAEDVVQGVFLTTWTRLREGGEVRELGGWLYRLSHNAALNAIRAAAYDHAELDEAMVVSEPPERTVERGTRTRHTLGVLASLPALQREALLRTAVHGDSHEEVARALGIGGASLRGLVYRARATLRAAAAVLTPAPWLARIIARHPRDTLLARGPAPWADALPVGSGLLRCTTVLLSAGALATGGSILGVWPRPPVGHRHTASDGRSPTGADVRLAIAQKARGTASTGKVGPRTASSAAARAPGHERARAGSPIAPGDGSAASDAGRVVIVAPGAAVPARSSDGHSSSTRHGADPSVGSGDSHGGPDPVADSHGGRSGPGDSGPSLRPPESDGGRGTSGGSSGRSGSDPASSVNPAITNDGGGSDARAGSVHRHT